VDLAAGRRHAEKHGAGTSGEAGFSLFFAHAKIARSEGSLINRARFSAALLHLSCGNRAKLKT